MEQAIKNVSGISNDNATKLVSGVKDADIKGAHLDLHFDGRANKKAIDENWKTVNQKIHNSTSFYELGKNLHTVQDFYAHSNYTELYVNYFKSQGGDLSKLKPGTIPLYENAPDEFKKYLEDNGLKTGEFHLPKYILGIDNKKDGTHHDEIAKDHPDSGNGANCIDISSEAFTLHDIARDLALRATAEILSNNRVEENQKQQEKEKAEKKQEKKSKYTNE